MPPSPNTPSSGSPRLGVWLVLSLALANLAVLGISILAVRASLHSHRRQAEVTTRNLADILEQNLSGNIRLLDLTLLQILDDPLLSRVPPPAASQLQALLDHHRARLPLLSALRVTDAEGQVIGGTLIQETNGRSIADRPYFQTLQAHPEVGLVVSPPVVSRFDQKLVLIFARARRDASGAFVGILYGVVSLQDFTRTLGIVEIGPKGTIAVRDANHGLITRYPSFPHMESRLGEQATTPEYLSIVQSTEGAGTFRKASPTDGIERTWTVRRVTGHPMWLVVGLAEVDYLATWRDERIKATATVLGSLLISVVLGSLLLRIWHQQVAAKGELALEKEKFQVLTEQTDDVIWSITPDGRFTYVSPSVVRQRGFTPEELMALPPETSLAMPDGVGFIRQQRERLTQSPSGSQPFAAHPLEVEHRRKDGTTFTGEVRLTVIWGPDGQAVGLRGITRDITERKRSQAEMEGLIHDLTMALAEVKELKGLLPICSACKKIRDDQGYWNQMETYISHHTDATFTHGMCPECIKAYFPDIEVHRRSKPSEPA